MTDNVPSNPGVAIGRSFVIVPREPHQVPDAPLRVPNSFCIECGQRMIRCWQCDCRFPITEVRDGYHLGRCDTHGPLAMICACKPALSSLDRLALGNQPLDLPKNLVTHIPESLGGPLDIRSHERMQREIQVGAVCLTVGFVFGVLLTIAAGYFIATGG